MQWHNVLNKIDECKKDLEYLINQKQNISLIEIDMVLNKLSLLYDALMTIKLRATVNEENGILTNNSELINKIIKESVFKSENIAENLEQKSNNQTEKQLNEPNEKDLEFSIEIKQEEPFLDISKDSLKSNENANNLTESKVTKTIAESIAKPTKTLADMMEEIYKKRDVASAQHFKSIKDLKHAISINDKIMFIRELFNNNVDNYNYVIEQVNSCNNLDEALAILDKNVKIDSNNQALNNLLELVYRRFLN